LPRAGRRNSTGRFYGLRAGQTRGANQRGAAGTVGRPGGADLGWFARGARGAQRAPTPRADRPDGGSRWARGEPPYWLTGLLTPRLCPSWAEEEAADAAMHPAAGAAGARRQPQGATATDGNATGVVEAAGVCLPSSRGVLVAGGPKAAER